MRYNQPNISEHNAIHKEQQYNRKGSVLPISHFFSLDSEKQLKEAPTCFEESIKATKKPIVK